VSADLAQIPLNFDHRPSLSGEDFLIADCNRDAVAWLDKWPEWPGQGLVIHGEAGCGKSHLASVFMTEGRAAPLSWQQLTSNSAHDLLTQGLHYAFEDADALEDEEALFHFYNVLRERGGNLLLTARTAPSRWPVKLPDLRSRLNALPAVEIGAPDDFLMEAVLFKHFSDRQLGVDRAVIHYLLARMERSFEAARRVVDAIDKASLASKRNITVPLVREVLQQQQEA